MNYSLFAVVVSVFILRLGFCERNLIPAEVDQKRRQIKHEIPLAESKHAAQNGDDNYDYYYGTQWYQGYAYDDSNYGYYDSWAGHYEYGDDQQWYYSGGSQYDYSYGDDSMMNSLSKEKQKSKATGTEVQHRLQKNTHSNTKNNEKGAIKLKRRVPQLKKNPQAESNEKLEGAHAGSNRLRGSLSLDKLDTVECCNIPPEQCNPNGVVCPLREKLSEIRQENVDPVCGCDGKTYSNSCFAENFGCLRSWTPGPCASS
jgi:hypothetical protein